MPIQLRVLLCLVLISAWGFIAESAWCLVGSRLHGQDVRSGTARFVDVGAVLGLQLASSTACWADFNNDGWSDLVAGS